MVKRIVTKIGDVFCVEVDTQCKRFFQYIANDMTQLNSSVIRAFKRCYSMDYIPDLEEIVDDQVEFYAHTVIKAGIMYDAWYKVGNFKEIGDVKDLFFMQTDDAGRKVGEPKIEVSERWYVWCINKPMVYIGKLPKKYYSTEIGIVISYIDIINRLKSGKYLYSYPSFK